MGIKLDNWTIMSAHFIIWQNWLSDGRVLADGVRTVKPGEGRAEPEHGLEMTRHDPPLVLLVDEWEHQLEHPHDIQISKEGTVY